VDLELASSQKNAHFLCVNILCVEVSVEQHGNNTTIQQLLGGGYDTSPANVLNREEIAYFNEIFSLLVKFLFLEFGADCRHADCWY
jgi:hypothetical protein